MFSKLIAALVSQLRRFQRTDSEKPFAFPEEPDALRDIEFASLDPASSSAADGSRLLCPVTRRELRRGDRVYRCRACQTAFSAAGWEFLKKVDRGKCCGCGMRNTVFPLE